MNSYEGIVKELRQQGSLSLVKVDVAGTIISAVVTDTPETCDYLGVDKSLRSIFKESEVIIGLGDCGRISLRNQFVGEVLAIDQGQLLSKVTVDTQIGLIRSIITTNAVLTLPVRVGDQVTAMVKTNEVMLSAI